MAGPNESLVPQLSKDFLRGLETDLRALSADARKRSPALKEEAERVILCLKEADTTETEAAAADKAAAVFCSACEKHESPAASSASQMKVSLKAVSSIHKLLIHRAVYSSRLPDILNALQRLSDPCVDDNVTLKVLQGILSILTIRGYAKSLNENEILQAFSLLFMVNSSGSLGAGHSAGTAFSAVSTGTSGTDVGVIEQTAKAAFRQVTSDLFASAADAAIQTAVERRTPSTEFIPMPVFPVEVRAAFNLFMDLINAASGDDLEWIPPSSNSIRPTSSLLHVALAIEVLDDNLASNIALFAGQPVFSEVLCTRLCPVIHRLLKTTSEKHTLRSLLSLVVSLVRHYWRALKPDTEALLHGLARMSLDTVSMERNDEQWASVYAVEALRCIFRKDTTETSSVLDLVRAFDLREPSRPCVGEAVEVACKLMSYWKTGMIERIPVLTLFGDMKPFMNIIRGTSEHRAAIATSLYAQIVDSAWEAVKADDIVAANALLSAGELELCAHAIERITDDFLSYSASLSNKESFNRSMKSFNTVVTCLARTAIVCNACSLESDMDMAIRTLSVICAKCITGDSLRVQAHDNGIDAADSAFTALLEIVLSCQESLGRSWLPILRAIEGLDDFVRSREKLLRTKAVHDSTAFAVFTAKIKYVLEMPTHLSWRACQDMIAAFVQCSLQTVVTLEGFEESDEVLSSAAGGNSTVNIFGMASAECSFLKALGRNHVYDGPEPASLWQLLSSHLTSVCMDSKRVSLRDFALKTLTRLACGIMASPGSLIDHTVVVAPFLDLLASHHPDVCIGCVNSVYTLLTTQGERLSDMSTWHTVLQTLSMAGGYKLPRLSPGDMECNLDPAEIISDVTRGAELVSEGFKVVQVIASDFLTLLSGEALFSWLGLLRVYCLQNEDVNVALTAVGLLWRTADFLARSPIVTSTSTDRMWVVLVITLKDISLDERPEVRRCAIKTLMGALSSHASKISSSVWGNCLQLALVPLLNGVLEGGMASFIDEQTKTKSTSEAPLLLHHSRDTPRKQWNETRVLALSGIAELLRVSLPYIVQKVEQGASTRDIPSFRIRTACWKDLFKSTSAAACSRDAEVAVAGISAILDYVHSIGTSSNSCDVDSSVWDVSNDLAPEAKGVGSESENVTAFLENTTGNKSDEGLDQEELQLSEIEFLWNESWYTLRCLFGQASKGDEAQKQHANIVNQKAVMMLVEGLLSVWHDLRSKFSPRSCQSIAAILMQLSFLSAEGMSAEFESPEDVARLEDVALSGLEEIATTGSATCKFCVVCEVLQTLSKKIKGVDSNSRLLQQKQASRAIFIIKVIFEDTNTPVRMKTLLMPKVIETLKPIITGKQCLVKQDCQDRIAVMDRIYEDDKEESGFWVAGVDALSSVMGSVSPECFEGLYGSVWVPYLQTVEEFMFDNSGGSGKRGMGIEGVSEGVSKKREKYGIVLMRHAVRVIGEEKSNSCKEAREMLLKLLTRGAEEGVTGGRVQFVQACQKVLFCMVDDKGKENWRWEDSCDACGVILGICEGALRKFIVDDQRAGRCPLPARRREEMVFLLSELIMLQRKSEYSRKQIVRLYGRLCECVESRDEALRYLARELLDEVAGLGHEQNRTSGT